jgi:hypothetical protein
MQPRRRWYRWLLVTPFVWQVGLAPLVNDVAAQPFGLPFPMLWQMLGIVLTSVAIAIVYIQDQREPAREEQAE